MRDEPMNGEQVAGNDPAPLMVRAGAPDGIVADGAKSDKPNNVSRGRWVGAAVNRILRIQPANANKFRFTREDDRFKPGGEFEALGYAVTQLEGRIGVDSDESVAEIVKQLHASYSDKPDQAELVSLVAKRLREGKAAADHDAKPLPVEFGGEPEPEKLLTLADARKVLGETRYLWRPYLMVGGLTAIAGDVGAGKTCFMLDLHRRQWHGLAWPDGSPVESKGRPVVYVMADQRLSQLADLAKDYGVPDDSIIVACEPGSVTAPLLLDDPASLDRISRIVREAKPWALVIDTFTSAMGGKSHSKPEEMNGITSYLHDVAVANDIPVILLCHTNAEGGIYGKALGRKCEHQLAVVLSNRHDVTSCRNIHPKRSRYMDEAASLGVRFDRGGWDYCEPWQEVEDAGRADGTVKPGAVRDQTAAAAREMAAVAGEGGFTQSELVSNLAGEGAAKEALPAVRNRVSRAVRGLVERGELREEGGRYFLPAAF